MKIKWTLVFVVSRASRCILCECEVLRHGYVAASWWGAGSCCCCFSVQCFCSLRILLLLQLSWGWSTAVLVCWDWVSAAAVAALLITCTFEAGVRFVWCLYWPKLQYPLALSLTEAEARASLVEQGLRLLLEFTRFGVSGIACNFCANDMYLQHIWVKE